ncbi:hypothetical protein CW362_19720 [Streptomyces populi]|uniref:Uncharacterized protein n=2 Tax=Streptomyces populi TaxID=2058924 RepID=A0A2I0SMY1_9ACTN|nr:hypothetical protein CW362_19720 [Streptomyces populi]
MAHVAAVRAIIPLIYKAARSHLADADLLIREAAVYAAAMTFAVPESAAHVPELVPLVRGTLGVSEYRGYQYMAKRCLVTWGVEPGPLPDPLISGPEPRDRPWEGGCSDDPPF